MMRDMTDIAIWIIAILKRTNIFPMYNRQFFKVLVAFASARHAREMKRIGIVRAEDLRARLLQEPLMLRKVLP